MSEYRELTPADLTERWRSKTPLEYIDEIATGGPGVEYKDADSALRWLLNLAWTALERSQREALNGSWSIACEWEVKTIIGLTSLVGPTRWDEVPADLVMSGVYERIHAAMGLNTPVTDADHARAQEVIDRRVR